MNSFHALKQTGIAMLVGLALPLTNKLSFLFLVILIKINAVFKLIFRFFVEGDLV